MKNNLMTMFTKPCLYCGIIIIKRNNCSSKRWNSQTKFCSHKCRYKWLSGRPRTHGFSKTRFYSVWRSMIQRCENPNIRFYNNYGGRGIKVCEGWGKFENFKADMFPTYREGLSIDRIDNGGNYEPSNCKWSTRTEQNLNRRRTTLYKIDG